MFKIEKGVPVKPTQAERRGRKRKYPFPAMKKGDSFAVPLGNQDPTRLGNSLHASARYAGVRVTVRNEGKAIRCWMVGRL